MKTTLEIPDELYRSVKAKAALEGRKVSEVVAEALRYMVQQSATISRRPLYKVEFPLIRGASERIITSDELKKIMAEMDEADDLKHAQLS